MTRKQQIVRLREMVMSSPISGILIDEADAGRVPVAALRLRLVHEFGPTFQPDDSMKQFIGKLIFRVLSKEGFAIAKKTNRVEDGMFERGASYHRVARSAAMSLLSRLIAALTPDERREAAVLLASA